MKKKEVQIRIRCADETRRRFKAFCAKLGKNYESGLLYLLNKEEYPEMSVEFV